MSLLRKNSLLTQDSLLKQDSLLICYVLPGDLQGDRCGVWKSSPLHNAFIRTKKFTDAGFFTNAGFFTDVLCVARWFAKQQMRRIIHSHTATHGNTLQHTATHCNTLQHTATLCVARWFAKQQMRRIIHSCSVLQCVAVCCSVYWCAVCCQVICKATDAAYNTQPERAESVWNIRGVSTHLYYYQTNECSDILYYYYIVYATWYSD